MKLRLIKLRLWGCGFAGLIVGAVSFPAAADLSDRYAIGVRKPDKAYGGTTIFGDQSDQRNPVIVEVDMTGKVVWSYDVQADRRSRGSGMDVEWLPGSDRILFTRESGVYEVDRNKKIVWSHAAPTSHDVDRLANGNTLMAWGAGDDSSDPEVREVDPRGTVVWKWHAAEHLKGEKRIFDLEGLTHTNSVVRLANGNTLVSLRNYFMLVEVAPSGQIVWKLTDLFTTPHDPEILPNGNILVNTRNPRSLMRSHRAAGSFGNTGPIRRMSVPSAIPIACPTAISFSWSAPRSSRSRPRRKSSGNCSSRMSAAMMPASSDGCIRPSVFPRTGARSRRTPMPRRRKPSRNPVRPCSRASNGSANTRGRPP